MELDLRAPGRGPGQRHHRGHLHGGHPRAEEGAGRLSAAPPLEERVAALDWTALARSLREHGHARTGSLLRVAECRRLAALWGRPEAFRKHVDMARHRFGEGRYGYFAEPLPAEVAALRTALYARLAPLANEMMAELARPERYPLTHAGYRRRCHAAGQTKPTPLLLRYEAGGSNRLHQDLYGSLAFPLQATALLSRPGHDFDGGSFLLVENRPRQQSLGEAIALAQGELVIFPVSQRPVRGARGSFAASVRHGVSRVTRGERLALGIIFHDAA